MELFKQVLKLIQSVGCDGSIANLKKHQDMFDEVAEHCRATEFYQCTEPKRPEFIDLLDADECFTMMALLVSEPHSTKFRMAVLISFIPIITDKLKEM